MDDKSADMENTIHCVEVRQSFKNSRSFYYSYLARSWCETIFGLILFVILSYYGIPSIWADELTHCNVHDVWYQCSGDKIIKIHMNTLNSLLLWKSFS